MLPAAVKQVRVQNIGDMAFGALAWWAFGKEMMYFFSQETAQPNTLGWGLAYGGKGNAFMGTDDFFLSSGHDHTRYAGQQDCY